MGNNEHQLILVQRQSVSIIDAPAESFDRDTPMSAESRWTIVHLIAMDLRSYEEKTRSVDTMESRAVQPDCKELLFSPSNKSCI